MARKQYRGVMVFDFEVDGKFSTVAKLEEAWDQFCEDMQAGVSATVSDVKIEQAQAELQDRRGKTGPIKNIVFRGGRGTNEKMSKSQMQRLEELCVRRWGEHHLNSDPRADLKGEERKLYNRLSHMADKEGLEFDEDIGRLRNKKSTALAYSDGTINHSYRFHRKVWQLTTAFNYDETDDELHGKIMRDIINGNIQDLDQQIFWWETRADSHMPPHDAQKYKYYLASKQRPENEADVHWAKIREVGSELPVNSPKLKPGEELEAERPEDLEEFGGPNDMRGKETFEFNKPGGKKTITRTIKFPVGTFKFDGKKGSFLASKTEFRNKLVHSMTDKERNEFLNGLLKDLLTAEKSETVSRITRVIRKAKKEPTADKFDDIWQTMDFKSMQGQKRN